MFLLSFICTYYVSYIIWVVYDTKLYFKFTKCGEFVSEIVNNLRAEIVDKLMSEDDCTPHGNESGNYMKLLLI